MLRHIVEFPVICKQWRTKDIIRLSLFKWLLLEMVLLGVSSYTKSNIVIYPYESGSANQSLPVEFQFSSSSNIITIEPNTGGLQPASIYEVTISGVKDSASNSLKDPCIWIFATTGAPIISTGKKGVCSTTPPVIEGSPEAPQNVKAEVIDATTVKVSWEAPVSGDTPTYYQVDRSIDNKQNFTTVVAKETKLTFTDSNAQTDIPHIYKVTAGNDTSGLSNMSELSNEVIPRILVLSNKPVAVLISHSASQKNIFGSAVSFSPDGLMLAVGEFNGDPSNAVLAGTVQLFAKNNTGFWSWSNTLVSNIPAGNNEFGKSISFSPNGLMLAVGEISGDPTNTLNAGTVQLFSKSTGWGWSSTLLANEQNKLFGWSLSFSPDGSTLAVGEIPETGALNVGTVQLFTKSSAKWIRGLKLRSAVQTAGNMFGVSLSFSPDGSLLVVGETNGDPAGSPNAGTVQLFRKNTNWGWSQTLVSNIPALGNEFGASLCFNSDGTMLAVGEIFGDVIGKRDVGVVNIFDITNLSR